MKIGIVKATAIQNIFNSLLYVFSSAELSASIGTKSIPQIGQAPGSSLTISGCIGQVHCSAVVADKLTSSTKSIPHTGQSPDLL